MTIRKSNPLKLNPLQLKTLLILQVLSQVKGAAAPGPQEGEVTISRFPRPHGDHFHLGAFVVSAKNMTGLHNSAVWHALERKGLARADWPHSIVLTRDGMEYDTEMGPKVLMQAAH
jgi:hypothetical protein